MQTETERSSWQIAAASENTLSAGSQILENFKLSKEYRHAFVEEKVRTGIAVQIKAIRDQRKMKRPEFASKMGKAPSWVFRLEDPNQPPPTISTLLQVAETFDVDLDIRFSPFSELIDRLDKLTPDSFEVPSFDEELKEEGALGLSKTSSTSLEWATFIDDWRELYRSDNVISIQGSPGWKPTPSPITDEEFRGAIKMPPQSEQLEIIQRNTSHA